MLDGHDLRRHVHTGSGCATDADCASGKLKWTKTESSKPDREDGGNSIAAGPDHNVFSVGFSDGKFMGQKNTGKQDAVLWRVKKVK